MNYWIIAGIVLLVVLALYLRARSRRTLWRRIAEKEGNDIFSIRAPYKHRGLSWSRTNKRL